MSPAAVDGDAGKCDMTALLCLSSDSAVASRLPAVSSLRHPARMQSFARNYVAAAPGVDAALLAAAGSVSGDISGVIERLPSLSLYTDLPPTRPQSSRHSSVFSL